MKKNIRISVLGGGLWGTVLAQHLSRAFGAEIWLWEFFPDLAASLQGSRLHPNIPELRLADGVRVTSDLPEAARGSAILLFVLPSQFLRKTAQALNGLLPKDAVVINASKGIEPGSLKTMGEIIAESMPGARARLCTLSGPSFAREVARGVPTKMLLAGRRTPQAERARRLLDGGPIRVDWSPDRKGVELGGSLKNVLAIGCGILDGLAMGAASGSEPSRSASGNALPIGANTKAALIIQGMDEMSRLITKCGGRPETIYGLSGLGDLIATGTSPESRNRAFGEKLGQGKTARTALAEIPTVVEGVQASLAAYELCRKAKLKAPLLETIWRVVHREGEARLITRSLGFH